MKRKNGSAESSPFSRRKFLLSSASAVAGVATFSSLGRMAHAAQGKYDRNYVYRIRIDRESEASHDLIQLLDKPVLYISKYLF